MHFLACFMQYFVSIYVICISGYIHVFYVYYYLCKCVACINAFNTGVSCVKVLCISGF